MALKDVSKMVTGLQKQCRFAEWFTRVFREPMTQALAEVFAKDLPEGEQAPEVLGMVDSLVRSLVSTFQKLSGAEMKLLTSLKKEETFRKMEVKLIDLLREAFDRARSICRSNYGSEKADEAGFPARMAQESLPLLRQTDIVSFNLRDPEFDLGENLVPGSNHDAQTILATFEPAARELQKALDDGNQQKAMTQGKQVEKNDAMASFKTTYGIYVAVVRGCFRLAGFTDLADRLALTVRRRSNGGTETDPPADDEPPDGGLPDDGLPGDVPPSVNPTVGGKFDEVPEIPSEFADLVRLKSETESEDDEKVR